MKKIVLFCIIAMLLTTAQTLYVPQVINNPVVSGCIDSQSETWYRWLCHPYWQPARTIDQPTGHPEWVSGQTNTTTQYQLADQTIWLVQHNTTQPGNRFAMLTVGEELKYNDWVWIQGRGGINKTFTLVEPEDPYSEWVDDATGYMYNTYEIVSMYDIAANPVILQTCVGQPVTGRRLVILR